MQRQQQQQQRSTASPQLHQRQCNSSDTSIAVVMCMKYHAIDYQPSSEVC